MLGLMHIQIGRGHGGQGRHRCPLIIAAVERRVIRLQIPSTQSASKAEQQSTIPSVFGQQEV